MTKSKSDNHRTKQITCWLKPEELSLVNEAKDKAKLEYDKKSNFIQYQVGDLALLYSNEGKIGKAQKLNSYYTGPYVIVTILPDHVYEIRLQSTPRGKKRVVHHNRLKPVKIREDAEEEEEFAIQPFDSPKFSPEQTSPRELKP